MAAQGDVNVAVNAKSFTLAVLGIVEMPALTIACAEDFVVGSTDVRHAVFIGLSDSTAFHQVNEVDIVIEECFCFAHGVDDIIGVQLFVADGFGVTGLEVDVGNVLFFHVKPPIFHKNGSHYERKNNCRNKPQSGYSDQREQLLLQQFLGKDQKVHVFYQMLLLR